jgi:hypothetical protein
MMAATTPIGKTPCIYIWGRFRCVSRSLGHHQVIMTIPELSPSLG